MKDRYRPVFCEKSFYQHHQPLFAEWVQLFAPLTSIEKAQAWVVSLSLLRKPDDWFGGIRKKPFLNPPENRLKHPLQLRQLASSRSQIKISPKLSQDLNLFELINAIYIKPLPETCLRALTKITNQYYPLEVIDQVPTPLEILSYQLRGKRVITLNEDYLTWADRLYHGRDFLSFMIHDLIHADHFFSCPQHRAGQLGFYRCIEKILPDAALIQLLQYDPFKEAFEYIISDMNSHPVHLFKTLHAHLMQSIPNEKSAINVWFNWTRVWSSEDLTIITALQKINTQLFSVKDAISLTSWCTTKGLI